MVSLGHRLTLGLGNEDDVEPLYVRREHPDHRSHIEHRHERADAHHVPVPFAEEDEHEHRAYDDERRVRADLHLAEVTVEELGYGQRKALAREHERVAPHLAGYAERKHRTANEQQHELQGIADERVEVGGNLEEARYPHRQVGIESEEERHEHLRKLPALKVPSQQQQLDGDEKHVHAYGQLSHGHAHARDQRKDIGRARYGRRAEIGPYGQRRAEGDYEKNYNKTKITAGPFRLTSFPCHHQIYFRLLRN